MSNSIRHKTQTRKSQNYTGDLEQQSIQLSARQVEATKGDTLLLLSKDAP